MQGLSSTGTLDATRGEWRFRLGPTELRGRSIADAHQRMTISHSLETFLPQFQLNIVFENSIGALLTINLH